MIQPIQTKAYGRLFRSRLEARYAVFLSALGVDWQYEPEGFELEAGWYLPDFFLPKVKGGTWLEIKPHGSGSFFGWGPGPYLEERRLSEFADKAFSLNGAHFFVAQGIPDPRESDAGDLYAKAGLLASPFDPHFWCVCGCGKAIGIEFDGRGDRIQCTNPGCEKSPHGDKGYSYDHPTILEAAATALSARFERGEGPQ